MNLGGIAALARRYAKIKAQQGQRPSPPPAIPNLPPGRTMTEDEAPTMRFNPNVRLDTSQIEDRRTAIDNLPILPGGRAGPGGDMYEAPLMQLALQFEAARAARNQTPIRRGVKKNGKSSRRY